MLAELYDVHKFYGTFIVAEVLSGRKSLQQPNAKDFAGEINRTKELIKCLWIPSHHFDDCVRVLQSYDTQFKYVLYWYYTVHPRLFEPQLSEYLN